jgi:hypothetical protein
MDLSHLKSLGEIAGLGGVALGVVVLLIRPIIGSISGLPKEARAGPVKLIVVGCFVIGVLGIAAWTIGNLSPRPQVATRGVQSPGVISGGDATVSYGPPPEARSGSPTASSPNLPGSSGTVRTEGSQSPGVIAGGKVGVEYGRTTPNAPSTPGTE